MINRASGQIWPVVEYEAQKSRAQAGSNTRAIKDVVVSESKSTKDYVNSSFNEHRSMIAQVDQVDILSSLRNPQMNACKNASAINSNHEGTYQWIFEDDQKTEATPKKRWNSFGGWLRSDESVYWISGKVGSGKSSLIWQLIDNRSTEAFLQQWRTDARVLSAFIWNTGLDLQKSQIGLLATLLQRLLSIDRRAAMQDLHESISMRSKQTILD